GSTHSGQQLLWPGMMRPPYRPAGLTAAQQYYVLRAANPLGGCGRLSRGSLTWVYSARPSPIGRLYSMELDYRQGEHPKVTVINPNLLALTGGKDLPHVYEQDPTLLCL